MKTGKLYKGLDWSVNIIIMLLSVAVAVFVYVSPKPSGYGYMFLHPLIFAFFYHNNLPLKEGKFTRPCLLFLFLTMLIRFVVGPLLMVLADFNTSQNVCDLIGPLSSKVQQKDVVLPIVSCTFEGEERYIPKNFDEILSSIYGDYMKLPPVEERVYKHDFNAFWL